MENELKTLLFGTMVVQTGTVQCKVWNSSKTLRGKKITWSPANACSLSIQTEISVNNYTVTELMLQ